MCLHLKSLLPVHYNLPGVKNQEEREDAKHKRAHTVPTLEIKKAKKATDAPKDTSKMR